MTMKKRDALTCAGSVKSSLRPCSSDLLDMSVDVSSVSDVPDLLKIAESVYISDMLCDRTGVFRREEHLEIAAIYML